MARRNRFIDFDVFADVIAHVPAADGSAYQDVDTVHGDLSRLVVAWLAATPPDELNRIYTELGWGGAVNGRAIHETARAWMRRHRPEAAYWIEPGQKADLPAILALLEASGLPEAGLAAHLATTRVVRGPEGEVVGCGALEAYGEVGLLRSVAVGKASRGRGLGRRMIEHLLRAARERGIREIYLLTETAEALFRRSGFVRVDRESVPEAIRSTEEFAEACPASAPVMRRDLTDTSARGPLDPGVW